jgi:hypothetical protein
MTNHRTTYRPCGRSDGATSRGTAGDLPTLALARGRTGIFGNLATVVDIPVRHFLTDLLKMGIGIQDRFWRRTARH